MRKLNSTVMQMESKIQFTAKGPFANEYENRKSEIRWTASFAIDFDINKMEHKHTQTHTIILTFIHRKFDQTNKWKKNSLQTIKWKCTLHKSTNPFNCFIVEYF